MCHKIDYNTKNCLKKYEIGAIALYVERVDFDFCLLAARKS